MFCRNVLSDFCCKYICITLLINRTLKNLCSYAFGTYIYIVRAEYEYAKRVSVVKYVYVRFF